VHVRRARRCRWPSSLRTTSDRPRRRSRDVHTGGSVPHALDGHAAELGAASSTLRKRRRSSTASEGSRARANELRWRHEQSLAVLDRSAVGRARQNSIHLAGARDPSARRRLRRQAGRREPDASARASPRRGGSSGRASRLKQARSM
jgi:hypothetical protein